MAMDLIKQITTKFDTRVKIDSQTLVVFVNDQRLGKGTLFTTTQKLRNNIVTISVFQNDGALGTFSLGGGGHLLLAIKEVVLV